MPMSDDLPTSLRVSAQIRIAAREGVSLFVTHKGHENSGTIYLKINKLDGQFRLLSQVRQEDTLGWMIIYDWGKEDQVDTYLREQLDFDPDLWVIEIEDRQGRHWFPEPIWEI